MGFLKSIFGGDPQRDLDRARAQLDSGEVERALELGRRALDRATPDIEASARQLVEEAEQSLIAKALEKASSAEASEYFDDAVEWLGVALEHVGDAGQRKDLEARQQSLIRRAERAQEEPWEMPPEVAPEPETELDPELHYQALVDMLVEDVAERYEKRPLAFRAAYVALNEGHVEEAHEAFEALASSLGEDPVVRFERGRCRLAAGAAQGAVNDFEAAWPSYGDQPIDLSGEVSVPTLWAEAMLVLGKPRQIIDRLRDLADPVQAAPLCERYAQALLADERFEEARDFLASAIGRVGTRDRFAFQLAQALVNLEDRSGAIDCLEMAIAPSCTTGCAPRAKYLPSFRALASLYLEEGTQPERVRELIRSVAQALGGRLSSQDHTLLAGYYDQVGDAEAAEHARDHARRLREDAVADPADVVSVQPAGMRAPL